jgi:DNA mismatch repair protein MutS
LAELDALAALAEAAARFGYVRPSVHGGDRLVLRGARHPVVERALGPGRFVPNDLVFEPAARQILLVTGPNMAGKSTYLRAAGLAVVMAQAGSFVPADVAEVGVVDRLFTRVGAADAVAAGQSTFMVEMVEVAAILREATPRSLVLLDEVGRGTSTYDGLALAWAITEELHRDRGPRARTLFATHYHELTRLARELPRLVNLHVRVREVGDDVVFLHEVSEGPADRSYGIHVARLAGLPGGVLARARRILGDLESQRAHALPEERSPLDPQLGLFDADEAGARAARDRLAALIEALEELDLEQLTPLAALNLLAEWKGRFGEEPSP